MNASDHRWAVVLPSGDGRSSLTHHGGPVPNQYCSLNGDDPMIRAAIQRARKAVAQERICVVVERDHRRLWWPLRSIVPGVNLLVQPRNCGTAIGILFALLEIIDRDPFAQVLFVPADHYFENEAAVTFAMNRALNRVSSGGLELALIAVAAEHAATDLAYIVPGARLQQDVYKVREFLHKPDARLAQHLCEQGSLWSTFLFGALGFSVLALLREYLPAIVDAMSMALGADHGPSRRIDALAELYERLPTVDFSRAVMQKSRSMMNVIDARGCGWAALGTPQRLQRALPRWGTCLVESTPHLDAASARA
jgi:mannose-1-phosphate guanylyltransferase